MPIFRNALGYVIRTERLRQGLTMRDISVRAPMALGYLSEVERGQKDVSSELFNTIARGLGLPISELTKRTADVLAEWEQQEIEQKELARLSR